MTEPRSLTSGRGAALSGPEHVVDERPVYDRDLDSLIGQPLARYRRVVLAVSGGSDSMALMVLVARWMASGRVPEETSIEVATVDHGLRPKSAREADWVAERARALGLRHTTLVWSGEKPKSGVQEEARAARYALLTAHAQAGRQPAAVVTAHTADDQAETLIMRLGRGSGLDGLAAMAPERPLMPCASVMLVRPLLGLSKGALRALLSRAGGTWIEDPSNECADFERVRLREAEAHAAALGLSNTKLALSARRLHRAREALDALTQDALSRIVDVHDGIYASLDRKAWAAQPADIRVRMLVRMIDAFGGMARPAQLSQVEALEAVLVDGRPLAQTLGGCMISQGWTTLRLYREPGRQEIGDVSMEPGREIVWDRRFRVSYRTGENGGDGEGEAGSESVAVEPPEPGEPVLVRPLGLAAYATLRDGLAASDRPPARAAATLPSIWSGGKLIAVPSLPGAPAGDGRFGVAFLGFERVG